MDAAAAVVEVAGETNVDGLTFAEHTSQNATSSSSHAASDRPRRRYTTISLSHREDGDDDDDDDEEDDAAPAEATNQNRSRNPFLSIARASCPSTSNLTRKESEFRSKNREYYEGLGRFGICRINRVALEESLTFCESKQGEELRSFLKELQACGVSGLWAGAGRREMVSRCSSLTGSVFYWLARRRPAFRWTSLDFVRLFREGNDRLDG